MNGSRRLSWLAVLLIAFPLFADEVVMKDGTVYKGKIMIDTDKSILIGNPPYDSTSYLLQSDDIAKIVYEEYHPAPPAERKRGLVFEARLLGGGFSSSELSLRPAAGLYGGIGFRLHPFFEIEGGLEYSPEISASGGGLLVSDTASGAVRQYEKFWMYNGQIGGRFYPFYMKKWPVDPFFATGYTWSRMMPKASGDSLRGSGWRLGAGAIRPMSTHWFLEARLWYELLSYDTIHFLGQEGQISPEIKEHRYVASAGISYRP